MRQDSLDMALTHARLAKLAAMQNEHMHVLTHAKTALEVRGPCCPC